MLAMMGDNIEHVLSYWLIFEAFHSAALGGFAVISHWLPALFLSVSIGALADRGDCRRIVQAGQGLFILVSAAWGLLFLTGHFEVWHACVLLAVHGLAGSLWGPANQLIIHDIVGPADLPSAVRLNSTARQIGQLFGPAVGGALLVGLGAPVGLLVNVLLYLPLTLWLTVAPYTGHGRAGAAARPLPGVSLGQAFGLLRQISANRTILSMVALAGVSALLVGNAYSPQLPAFAADLGTAQAGFTYSVLLGAHAAGAVLGGFVLEGGNLLLPRARTAFVCAFIWCLALGGFALSSSYPLSVALLFVAGVSQLAFSSMAQTLVQLLAPPALRGRAIGLFSMAQNGLRAFSGVSIGLLGAVVGIHWSLGLSVTALLVAMLGLVALLSAPARRLSRA